ncbi:MAG TPA: hypothetical protein P5026_02645 [Kiritimatiellia bacterium]|nr:hypothetical protein [Kiritimatiellia bacterium]
MRSGVCLAGLLAVSAWMLRAERPCENWLSPYAGDDVTGEQVLGLWTFTDLKDASGKGRDAVLHGAVLASDASLGGCLESFCGWPVEDKRHAAVVANHPTLSPRSAFTLEMWIKPKPEFTDYPEAFLVDKKYVAHTDYQWTLGAADKSGRRRVYLRLGFGDDSENYGSEPSVFVTNVWTHLAVTYDGSGTVRFFRDGAALGTVTRTGRGRIAPGRHPLSIGDRIGSLYHGFPGYLTRVRLCQGALEFRPVTLALASDRSVFVRMEKTPSLRFTLANAQRQVARDVSVRCTVEGRETAQDRIPELAPGAVRTLEVPIDTSLRPGSYTLRVRVSMPLKDAAPPYVSEESATFTLVPRRPPRMPVVMWGLYGAANVLRELPRLTEIGFTHCLGFGADYGRVYEAGKPVAPDTPERVAEVKRMLDTALAHDLGIIATLSPGHWAANAKPEFRRVDSKGARNDKKPALCVAFPEMQTFAFHVGASVAQVYSDFPAWQAALLHTEVRDGANVCWHAHDREAFRRAAGEDYPMDAPGKSGVEYTKLAGFPPDRVIPDDHPLLRFLSWYWKEGDGWNRMNSELHRGLRSTGREGLWTFHDPAVRVASVYGSGGSADVLSQWTYSYPDPIRIGVATDELFAMARGAAQPQQVMKMTQIIWYRSQTAPAAKGDEVRKAPASPWEDTDPDAAFPTIAPMHLREAFWTKLARPVRGIMYHGWGSLVPQSGEGSYRYTHPQTQHELRRLIREVVEPLGPALLKVPDRPSDVAFLESFASQMFARRGTYGWGNGWSGDAYQMLLWAHLQPEIIYDETVQTRGLDGYRVLVMMDCDVLTAGVVAAVKAFQARGGMVVGDERLCPAIRADMTVTHYTRTRKADEDRAALIAKAAELRAAIDTRYQRYCDASTPDVVPRCRSYGSTDYLFAVNDRREFGDYVGQHGLVMENGLPAEATLSLARSSGYVYDLTEGRALETHVQDGRLTVARAFDPCDGCVLMVTERAIAAVRIDIAKETRCGGRLSCTVSVEDREGKPIDAVVPVHVEILDPAGAQAEWSGYYGAERGQLVRELDLAPNDRRGLWQIRVRELASRRCATAYFRVK